MCGCPSTFNKKPLTCYGSCSYMTTSVFHAHSLPSSTEIVKEVFMYAGYILKLSRNPGVEIPF